MRLAANGAVIGHSGRTGIVIEPANDLVAAVFEWDGDRSGFFGLRCRNPVSDHTVVVEERDGGGRLVDGAWRIAAAALGEGKRVGNFGLRRS